VQYDSGLNPVKLLKTEYPYRGKTYSESDPTALVFELPGNLVEYEYPEDGSTTANAVYGIGPGSNEGKLIATASVPSQLTAGWPFLEDTATYNDVYDATLLGNITSAEVLARQSPINTTKIIFIGAVAGSSSAFFGLGGATLLTPLLSIWASLPMLMCINISLLFVAVTSFLSLLTLGSSWIYFHGLDNLTFTIASLIMLMGVTAAISQTLISRGLFRIKDSLRRKLLGFYLISLFFWMLYKALFL
jgi:hypothetical protein